MCVVLLLVLSSISCFLRCLLSLLFHRFFFVIPSLLSPTLRFSHAISFPLLSFFTPFFHLSLLSFVFLFPYLSHSLLFLKLNFLSLLTFCHPSPPPPPPLLLLLLLSHQSQYERSSITTEELRRSFHHCCGQHKVIRWKLSQQKERYEPKLIDSLHAYIQSYIHLFVCL